jgi:hypothetical protein
MSPEVSRGIRRGWRKRGVQGGRGREGDDGGDTLGVRVGEIVALGMVEERVQVLLGI